MKKLVFIIIPILLISACSPKMKYLPKHENEWAKIDDSIRQNWINASGVCSPSLHDSFAYAFWCGNQFYWDTYFTQLGLLAHDEIRLSKGGANNLLHLVDSMGFAPNANADWGDNRSQPPYLSQIVTDIFHCTQDTVWLSYAYNILLKEYKFWTDTSSSAIENHSTSISGLQRYSNHATREELITLYTTELVNRFSMDPKIDTLQMLVIADNFATEAATGMDFTTRFEHRCADFVAVDLNSNLYLYEQNFASMEKILGISDGKAWKSKAQKRKDLLNKYCWDETRGLYLDYDYINQRCSKVVAATTFSPLYSSIASKEQAKRVVANLPLLESEWGIITTEDVNESRIYQWDHVSVWPPMQSLVFMGLNNYGYKDDAKRVAMKYLDLVAENYLSPKAAYFIKNNKDTVKRESGHVYEKYSRDGSINDREYNASVMMGWSAGTYAFIYHSLIK